MNSKEEIKEQKKEYKEFLRTIFLSDLASFENYMEATRQEMRDFNNRKS